MMKEDKPATSYMRNFIKAATVAVLTAIPAFTTGQTNSDGTMPQYLFDSFSNGKIVRKDGKTETMLLNYNIVTGYMVFVRNDQYYDLANPEMVDTIIIQNCKFIPAKKVFYEVLFSGTIGLFADHKGSLQAPAKEAGYGTTSELAATDILSSINRSSGIYNLPLPREYLVKKSVVYWISKGNDMFDFVNEKQFLKLFPDKATELKTFIKTNRLKFYNQSDVVRVISHYVIL